MPHTTPLRAALVLVGPALRPTPGSFVASFPALCSCMAMVALYCLLSIIKRTPLRIVAVVSWSPQQLMV